MEEGKKEYKPNRFARKKNPDEVQNEQEIKQEREEFKKVKKRRRKRHLCHFLWRLFSRLVLIVVIITIPFSLYGLVIKTSVNKTGMDQGLGFPLCYIQWFTYRVEKDLGKVLQEKGYYGIPLSRGGKTNVDRGALIVGDVLLSPHDKNLFVSTYDRDPLMETCTITWISQPDDVKAKNPCFIVYGVTSKEKMYDIIDIILNEYDYQSIDDDVDYRLDGWEGGK